MKKAKSKIFYVYYTTSISLNFYSIYTKVYHISLIILQKYSVWLNDYINKYVTIQNNGFYYTNDYTIQN